MKKSQLAGILFGVAMGVLFSVSMGTVGFVLGAGFVSLGIVMFKGLDDPPDKKGYKSKCTTSTPKALAFDGVVHLLFAFYSALYALAMIHGLLAEYFAWLRR